MVRWGPSRQRGDGDGQIPRVSSYQADDDTPLFPLTVDFLSSYISLGGMTRVIQGVYRRLRAMLGDYIYSTTYGKGGTYGGDYKQSICTGDSSCEGEQSYRVSQKKLPF